MTNSLYKLTQAEDAAWREYLSEYGAWSDEEIAEMTPDESTALFVQFVSGDYRELESSAHDAGHGIDSLTAATLAQTRMLFRHYPIITALSLRGEVRKHVEKHGVKNKFQTPTTN